MPHMSAAYMYRNWSMAHRKLDTPSVVKESFRSMLIKKVPHHTPTPHGHCYYLANARHGHKGETMDEISLSDIIGILEDVEEDVDYESEESLVDDRILDSFDILSSISALNDEFDISIPAKDVVPENFNSAEAMLELVQRLIDED